MNCLLNQIWRKKCKSDHLIPFVIVINGLIFFNVYLSELLRKISSSALKSTDAKSPNSQSSSGPKLRSNGDKPFEFKDLKYFNFDFCEAHGLSEDGIAKVKSWLLKNA